MYQLAVGWVRRQLDNLFCEMERHETYSEKLIFTREMMLLRFTLQVKCEKYT